jgi:hypothetical protein
VQRTRLQLEVVVHRVLVMDQILGYLTQALEQHYFLGQ